MSTYGFGKLFAPRAVAVVGASAREDSTGRAVLANLRAGGFPGSISVVNPYHAEIDGLACAPRLADLAQAPDLVMITAPAESVPGLVAEAGARGVGAAVVASPLRQGPDSAEEAARAEARRHGLRLVGPNSLGLLTPHAKLNLSFAARGAVPGHLALVSQSGAIAAALLEWAAAHHVGFSGVITLGESLDVDVGDCLDHFAVDRATRAILLYVESVNDAAKFMSAARAAARAKPVVVIKGGRHAPGARAAATHTGALAGSDAVYEAAFRRAGLLRVRDLDQLFAAAETLVRQPPFAGKRLAVLSNSGGLGVLAVDRLTDLGGRLAELKPETREQLDRVLPETWSGANPVDLIGDADGPRYAAALEAVLADDANDAVLVLHVPILRAASAVAEAVAETVRRDRAGGYRRKPVFAAWLGRDGAADAAFERAGLPHYASEAEAVRGFMHLVGYREAQDTLMETPDSLPTDFAPDTAGARAVVAGAMAEGRRWLNPIEVNRLLRAYDIPVAPVTLAADAEEAVALASPILDAGGTVAVKVLSPDIVHKSDVGGVRLDLTGPEAVREAALDLVDRARRIRPNARIAGLIVQPMVRRPKARELIAGLADDFTFGPVVVFGQGGTAVELINDKSLALPPLDLKLAGDLVARTQVSRILDAYRDQPAADRRGVELVLVKVAQMAADLPELRELDINPLLADAEGVIAVDARATIAPLQSAGSRGRTGRGSSRLAVRPYPVEWERGIRLDDGRPVLVRPVRPEDEGLFLAFLKRVTEADLRLRFFAPVRDFSHSFLARLVQIDYARAIAFVALDVERGEMLGVARLHADHNLERGEYAILLRSDMKGRGLGWALMELIIAWSRAEGLRAVEGQVLRANTTMLELCRKLGFEIRTDPDDPDIKEVSLPLNGAGAQAS